MEYSSGEDAKSVEMTTKDLEYYKNLINQQQSLREFTPILKDCFYRG